MTNNLKLHTHCSTQALYCSLTLSEHPFRQDLVCPVQHKICLTDWLTYKSAFPHSTPQPSCPLISAFDARL